jgi:signal transduction histidine kinase
MTFFAPDFQLLFQESPDVLLVLLPDSPRFTAVAATRARLESTHSTLEGTLGRGLFELFPDNPADGQADGTGNLRASLERVLATRAPDTMAVQKYDIPLPGGGFEVKYWSPRNIPVLSPQGEVLYILHRAVDVSDLIRADEVGAQLRGRSEEMEREVVCRSRELAAANLQLRDSNTALSQLDAAKTTFFNNISHEFRTPLTLMLGPLADALADSTLSAQQRQRLRLAQNSSMRLLKLVNSLLDFSRLEAGRMPGRFAPEDLAALTRDLAMMFQSAVEDAGVKLTIDCPHVGEPVWLDRDMWEKIVPNLVSNAFKFTHAGEISVRVRATPSHALLEVGDSGIGIRSDDLPFIFDRFHRVEEAAGRSYEGTGIGLSLVRELVSLHGGRIEATSEYGRGTTFTVSIPKGRAHLPEESCVALNRVAVPSAVSPHAREAAGWAGSTRLTSAGGAAYEGSAGPRSRVLVVDDNPDLRNYMRDLLSPQYDTAVACDGTDALERMQTFTPDIVLSDVMMPRMNGLQLAQALRTNPETVAVPVILLSARAGEEAAVEGLDAGCDDYLTKPFTAQELLARVRAHLQLATLRRRWTHELERANRELDAFSYSVAHDLRAPLRVIDGFGLILEEEAGDRLGDEGRRRLAAMRDAAKRMTQLIDDLLYLSRLARGELNRRSFDLSVLVNSVAAQLQSVHANRRVRLVVPEQLAIHADVALIKIALENLLGNAWKFTAKRADACIEVGMEQAGAEPVYFIRDNGAGFDMKYVSKLFGAFQRLHTDAEFQGTGIGLATVHRIIQRHGGRIWATAEPNRGATFRFTLGAQPAGAQAAA